MTNHLFYTIALTKIPKVGAMTAKTLISYCGGAEEVFNAKKSTLLKIPGIGQEITQHILKQNVLSEAESEMSFINKNNVQALFYNDKKYPQRLRKYNDCPLLLFYKGNADLNMARIVGIIGTRNATHQGISICEEIVEGLRPYNVIILSGLAYGIDIAAHRAALSSQQKTVGVLANGLAKVYPAAHKKVAQSMIENGGLLSEYTSNARPIREHFPMRNRIVAGLSDALVVIETADSGGSMITATRAAQYGKPIFAVPGRIKDKYSQGCNSLIQQNKAILLQNAEEIAYSMHWQLDNDAQEALSRQGKLFEELTESQKQIIDLLSENDETQIDVLIRKSQLPSTSLSSMLLELEFKGLVKSLPGKCYALT